MNQEAAQKDRPKPSVTTDILVFSIREKRLQILLIKRDREPFLDQWAIPGGFLHMGEDLIECARRELREETRISEVPLEQFRTYGTPGRDPRGWVVSTAFLALVPSDHMVPKGGSDAKEARWFAVDDLPPLAFDHSRIVDEARQKLVQSVTVSVAQTGRVAFDFLPAEFSLYDARKIFEILRGEDLDKGNFRKWLMATWQLEETGGHTSGTGYRAAALYRLVATKVS